MSEGSGERSSSSCAVVSELSVCFRDELTASVQGALAVAVELVVAEVSKLVSQALRDVREQMHQTLRNNQRLQTQLLTAETELRSLRDRLEEEEQRHQHKEQLQNDPPAAVDLSPEQIVDCLMEAELKYKANASCEAEVKGYKGSSFCEIREDGSVCTQDLKRDLTEEESTVHQLAEEANSELSGLKENRNNIQEHSSHFDQLCVGPDSGAGASAILMEGPVSHETNPAAPEVTVKVEKAERGGPDSGSLSEVSEEFGSDCLSLAQSKLLEDWKPESLQLQSCQSDSFNSSATNALADPSIFPGEIPDLDFLTSASSSQPDTFPAPPHSHKDVSCLPDHDPQQHYPSQNSDPSHNSGPSQHVCKLCGQYFHRQSDLRRHRSLMHQKQSDHRLKGPKRSLFPPGRSPYHCSQCGRDFNRMEHLKIHQRIHTGERPYVCTVCSASFRHSWALTRHFRIHTGEMPYQCGQCGRTFRNCGGLKFHQRAHARGQLA